VLGSIGDQDLEVGGPEGVPAAPEETDVEAERVPQRRALVHAGELDRAAHPALGQCVGRLLVAHGVRPLAVPERGQVEGECAGPFGLHQLLADRPRVRVREDQVDGVPGRLEVRGRVGPEVEVLAAGGDVDHPGGGALAPGTAVGPVGDGGGGPEAGQAADCYQAKALRHWLYSFLAAPVADR
jgi:hypothetical protein